MSDPSRPCGSGKRHLLLGELSQGVLDKLLPGPEFSEPKPLDLANAFTHLKGYKGRLINLNLDTTPGPVAPPPSP
jgi:hypothetical protein